MVTPTFVFSVSILTMAILAFGTTQTYLRFSSAGPGPSCPPQGCPNPDASHSAGGTSSGGPMAAGAGHKAVRPSPSPGKGAPGPRHQASSRAAVHIGYRTTDSIPNGFVAQISLTYRGVSPVAGWWLSFRYPGVRVLWMAGVSWHADGGTVVVEPVPGASPLRSGMTLAITLAAMGDPGPPDGCLFDGARCRIAGWTAPTP